jgi:hypothetical protein
LWKEILMSSASAPLPTPEGPGSVSGAPNLPAGFTGTFTSRYIDTGELRLHAVIGGEGPPLLLVHGWPDFWYAWRLLMPALARDFGTSPSTSAAWACPTNQRRLRHRHPRRRPGRADGRARLPAVRRGRARHRIRDQLRAGRGPPGPGRPRRARRDSRVSGNGSGSSAFPARPLNDRLWHLGFNRIDTLNEQLVAGREDAFYRWEFDAAAKKLPDDVIDYYVRTLSNPDSLRGSFG